MFRGCKILNTTTQSLGIHIIAYVECFTASEWFMYYYGIPSQVRCSYVYVARLPGCIYKVKNYVKYLPEDSPAAKCGCRSSFSVVAVAWSKTLSSYGRLLP